MLLKATNALGRGIGASVDYLAGKDDEPGKLKQVHESFRLGVAGHPVEKSKKNKKNNKKSLSDLRAMTPAETRAHIREMGLDR